MKSDLYNSTTDALVAFFKETKNVHKDELFSQRGLDPIWCACNCRSIDANAATDELGYTAKSDGLLLKGDGIQIQFKPDKPWKAETDDDKRKAPKYRSPVGDYDAMLPTCPDDPKYWTDLEKLKERCWKVEGHPCLVVTEGFFKAIAGCSLGIPTIALLGVEMGLTSAKLDPQGKRYLVSVLEKFAKAGFGFVMAFDADVATNENVLAAQEKLAAQLDKFGATLYIATGLWKVDEGKGMDDYIQENGVDKFKNEVLARVKLWEKQFSEPTLTNGKNKLPTPREIGLEIAEKYQPEWAFHNEQQVWRTWNGKSWQAVDDNVFGQKVFNEIECKNINYSTDSYIENTIKTIKRKLTIPEWKTSERKRFIPFQNCILDLETGKTLKYYPGSRFTSILPRDYTPLENISTDENPIDLLQKHCPNIYNYMAFAMEGDEKRILKLIAIINGVLKWRFHDLEMFVYLVGLPGSGKSTFARLLEKVVGKQNHEGSSLSKLDDPYELARIIDAQLVVCPDEDKKAGNFGGLKRLTGGDSVSYRQIYKSPASSPFYGSLVLISNNNIFAGDTAGIKRRCCLVTFDNPLNDHQRNSKIETLMETELSALTSVALTIPDNQVTEILRGLGESNIPLYRQKEWMLTCNTNSVAGFIEDNIIASKDDYVAVAELYKKYLDYVEDSGQTKMAKPRFSQEFVGLLTQHLGWERIEHGRIAGGTRTIKGIRLRTVLDTNVPLPSDLLGQPVVTAVTVSDSSVTASDTTSKPLPDGGFNGLVTAVTAHFKTFEKSDNNCNEGDDVANDAEQSKISAVTPVALSPQGFQPSLEPPLPEKSAVTKVSYLEILTLLETYQAYLLSDTVVDLVAKAESLENSAPIPDIGILRERLAKLAFDVPGQAPADLPENHSDTKTKERTIAERFRNVCDRTSFDKVLSDFSNTQVCVLWVWWKLLTDDDRKTIINRAINQNQLTLF